MPSIPRIPLSRRLFARTALLGGAAALPLARTGAAEAATGSWNLAGNTGTDPKTNYLGTKDAKPLVVRTTAVERLRVTPDGKVGIGTNNPLGRLHVVRSDGGAIRGDYTGTDPAQGVRGLTTSPNGYGVLGENTSPSATGEVAGVVGRSAGSGAGVAGSGYRGVTGSSSLEGGYGLYGVTTSSGRSTIGVSAAATGLTSNAIKAQVTGGGASFAVWAVADANSYAGFFQGLVRIDGDLNVNGTVSKSAGTFKIDHPLDPAGKYLYHSFVESPDMLNVYSGTVTVGPTGKAEVVLPGYFDALNTDVRYQLTAVGAAMPDLHVAVPYARGRFTIGGAVAGKQVCWQVTGVRQDAYAKAHRVVPEVDKPAGERGTYLHPVEHGKPETLRTTPR